MLTGQDERPDPDTVFPFATDAGLYPGVDMRFGPDGTLYYVSMFADGWGPGSIHRVEYFSSNQPPIAQLSADPEWSTEMSFEATLDASGSSDPDDDPVAYEWDLDGDGEFDAPSTESSVTETFEGPDSHTVSVRVVDPHGGGNVARVTLYPGESPPQPQIITPDESLEWGVGEEIEFEGEAEDAHDGDLPATSLDWSARLLHCPDGPEACHPHQLPGSPAVASGDFTAPDHDYPTRIELTLTATDSRGLSNSTTVELEPRTVDLSLDTQPSGLSLGAGLVIAAAPFVLRAIEGSNVALIAPQSQQLGEGQYAWQGWSDGGERVHQVVATESKAYTAFYQAMDLKEPFGSFDPGVTPTLPGSWAPRLRHRPRKVTRRTAARFAFSAPNGNARFLCRLDGAPFEPCRSPLLYRDLEAGLHAFRVVAVDASGMPESKRTVYRWKVLPKGAAGS